MNAELAKVRRNRNYKEEIGHEPVRMKEKRMDELMYQLNINIRDLYMVRDQDNIDISLFSSRFIANIFLILNAFNEIGVYPDYFYNNFFKLKFEYQKIIESSGEYKNDDRFLNGIRVSTRARISEIICKGLKNGHGKLQAKEKRDPNNEGKKEGNVIKKDINSNYKDMINYFKTFNMPYGINTPEQCKKIFEKIQFNHVNIIQHILLADDLADDIECLVRLLFEYLSFFVAMGIPPKDLLDEYIERVGSCKNPTRNIDMMQESLKSK